MRAGRRLAKRIVNAAGFDVRRQGRSSLAVAADLFPRGPAPPVVFDVGAHRGETVESLLRLVPDGRFWCFEPLPEEAHRLRQRFTDRVEVEQVALAERRGVRTLHLHPDRTATSSLLPRPSGTRRYYPANAELPMSLEVTTTTLDAVSQEQAIARIDLLKLDVQGAEGMVLDGAEGMLEEQRISVIHTEVSFVAHYDQGILYDELGHALGEYGYTLFGFYNLVWARNGQLRFGDAIFVDPQVRATRVDAAPTEP